MSGRYPLNLPVDLKQEAELVAQQQGISLNQLILWSLAEKVTALKSKLDDPKFPDITYKMDTESYPVPVLRGRGLRVQTIVISANVWNESAAEIAHLCAGPNPPVTRPVLKHTPKGDGKLTFEWDTINGQMYHVESATNLVNSGWQPVGWQPVGDSIIATNTLTSVSYSVGSERQRFYRVVTP